MLSPTQRSQLTDVLTPWSSDLLAGCHESLRMLHAYWDQKRGTRAMPARGDLDPVDLKPLLPVMTLIDVVPDERRYVYRLVGTREVEMRRQDPTGKPVSEAYYAESPGETVQVLDHVVMTRQPALFRGVYQPFSTRTQSEDVVYLPLSQDGETVNMILVLGHVAWIKDERRALANE
jgi:hypothetical protein